MTQFFWLGLIQAAYSESCLPCPDDWSKVMIRNKTECLRNIGEVKIENAAKSCEKRGGQLPITMKENNDMQKEVQKLWPKVFQFVINLNDVVTEGRWLSSEGKLASFFNWSTGIGNNIILVFLSLFAEP